MRIGGYDELFGHVGHDLSVVAYAEDHEYEGDPATVALECKTCGEILQDYAEPDEGKRR